MKKKFLLASLLLAVVALLGVSCTSEEATEEIIGGMAISGFAGVFICMAVVGGLIGLFLFVLWIITIVDCAKRKNEEFPDAGDNTKTIWLVVLIVTWVVGFWWVAAIVYYFMVMKKMPLGKK